MCVCVLFSVRDDWDDSHDDWDEIHDDWDDSHGCHIVQL